MTARTTHPPEPQFYVCRACRAVMDDPQPAPFCSPLCAADWAYTMCEPSLPGNLLASQPPDAASVSNWRERERYALGAEVR